MPMQLQTRVGLETWAVPTIWRCKHGSLHGLVAPILRKAPRKCTTADVRTRGQTRARRASHPAVTGGTHTPSQPCRCHMLVCGGGRNPRGLCGTGLLWLSSRFGQDAAGTLAGSLPPVLRATWSAKVPRVLVHPHTQTHVLRRVWRQVTGTHHPRAGSRREGVWNTRRALLCARARAQPCVDPRRTNALGSACRWQLTGCASGSSG